MAELHEILAERVAGWRATAYAHETHPAIGEILLHARLDDGSPRIAELYERLIGSTAARLTALGLSEHKNVALDIGYEGERRGSGSTPVVCHRAGGMWRRSIRDPALHGSTDQLWCPEQHGVRARERRPPRAMLDRPLDGVGGRLG